MNFGGIGIPKVLIFSWDFWDPKKPLRLYMSQSILLLKLEYVHKMRYLLAVGTCIIKAFISNILILIDL